MLDHYENPRNVGAFKKGEVGVGTGVVGAPACGDVMKLQIKVNEEGKIIDAKFKTFGCGSAIASSSLATEWVKVRSSPPSFPPIRSTRTSCLLSGQGSGRGRGDHEQGDRARAEAAAGEAPLLDAC